MDATRAMELATAATGEFRVPGAQLALLRGEDRVVVCTGTRAADGDDPILPSTPSHAGSIGKSLAALVILDAARRGEIALDVPCDQQAAGLSCDTPRALMAQTTGLPEMLPGLGQDLESFVAEVLELPRNHAPGRFSYSNAGWSVLDLLLVRRCGRGFEEQARAALPGTTFGMPPGAAQGHVARAAGPLPAVHSDAGRAASAAGARWWATANDLLDYARLHLDDGGGRFHPEDVREMRRRYARMPGATVSDGWGLGWALWDRGDHQAFGWAGYTAGHRAFLRCFPQQRAALVLLTNSAGSLFGPPGGSAMFDAILPEVLELLEVPHLPDPQYPRAGQPSIDVAGAYGPLAVEAKGEDSILVDAVAFGEPQPIPYERLGGDTYLRSDRAPGGIALAFEEDLLYLGPFAFARSDRAATLR